MRPRLIAVDDSRVFAGDTAAVELQGGHGGSPWMTAQLALASHGPP